MKGRRSIGALWLAATLVLTVAWPGTPPGNYVRDASGAVSKAGTALCETARPARPALPPATVLPAALSCVLPDLQPPAAATLVARREASRPHSTPPPTPSGARAPPSA